MTLNIGGTLFLLSLLVCTEGSAPNSTWWPCSTITPYQNLQLEQILGQWYLVEMASSLPGIATTCAGMRLILPNGNSWKNITMVGHESPGGNSIFYENHTIILPDFENSPSLWEQPDIAAAVMVTDVDSDNGTLALTTCHRFLGYDWTGVFSREKNPDSTALGLVNERLSTAGVQHIDSAIVLNTTGCPFVVIN